jgi:hypothetical protein
VVATLPSIAEVHGVLVVPEVGKVYASMPRPPAPTRSWSLTSGRCG